MNKIKNITDAENWVHQYLNNEGNNPKLSIGLKKQKRYWAGPIRLSLTKLHRCCGYESDMEYKETESVWNKRIKDLSKKIDDGWAVPPLIATYKKGKLSIRDGNHRYEALKKCKKRSYWAIIWYDTKKDVGKGL